MELATAGESAGPPGHRMFHPPSSSMAHPQQQPQQHRFGAPDSRASYSERRMMGTGAAGSNGRSTSHNHPSNSPSNGQPWTSSSNHHPDVKSGGRSFSSGMSALSRSNGSLANSSSAGSNSPANDTDANGNSKTRSRTQVRLPFHRFTWIPVEDFASCTICAGSIGKNGKVIRLSNK